jgi:hypothetical protein
MSALVKKNGDGEIIVKNPVAWISLLIMILLPLLSVAVSYGLTKGALNQTTVKSDKAFDMVNNHEVRISILESDICYLKNGIDDIKISLEKVDARLQVVIERTK